VVPNHVFYRAELPPELFPIKTTNRHFLLYWGCKCIHSPLSFQIKAGLQANNLKKSADLWYHSEFFAGGAQTDGICTVRGEIIRAYT
jgi:hypothetical protein